MAKGSGGVGKAGKGATVSGAKAAVAPAAKGASLANASMDSFADAVNKAADAVKVNSMAPIIQVYEKLKPDMSLDAFKKRLIDGFRADKLDMARNDLGVDRYSSDMLRKSETDMSGRVFVFIRRSDY